MVKYNRRFFKQRGDRVRPYFENLLGNKESKERIAKAIENGVLPHALLISGPSGSGKSTFALEIAAALNCEKKGDTLSPLPCAKCNNCRRIYNGSFPDVKLLTKPRERSTLGVEAVKDFREDMFLSATESDHKVYIIDDAETMTAEAQNSLLKILEEPPIGVTIILLARECDRILTTIKSRVQYVAMTRFSDEELKRNVLNRIPEAKQLYASSPEQFAGIIIGADGRLGLAAELFDPKRAAENLEDREETMKIIRSLGGRALYSDMYNAISSLPTKRVEFSAALERLILAIRDLITVKYVKEGSLLFFTSYESATAHAKDLTVKRLLSIYDAINETHDLCAKNANVQNLTASLIAKLKCNINR